MSGKVAGMVWELAIPHGHAWVLMSLADHAHHDGTKVYPGNGLTAWKTGYSVSQVKRIVRDLVREYGLLEPVSKGSGTDAAEYRICLEKFAAHRKPEMKGRGRPSAPQKNGGHGEPGLSDPPPVGAPTRAHDDGTVIKEPSNASKEAADSPPPDEFQGWQVEEYIREELTRLGKDWTRPVVRRYTRQANNLHERGADPEAIYEAADRVVGEWHRVRLTLDDAKRDVENGTQTNGKPPQRSAPGRPDNLADYDPEKARAARVADRARQMEEVFGKKRRAS